MATPRNPLETFIWGSGGRAMTPEQVAREREIAAALTDQGADFSPVGHWLQGAARLGHSAAGAFRNWRADEAESAGRGALSDRWSSVFGGGSSPVAEALSSGVASPALDAANAVAAMPTGDMAGRIRAGLMERGLPEHVANAFILNMQDESGLNPGINEAAPIVPGSRGGYGLYQLTGPRRRDYEAFAAERGVAPDDVDAQLDWLMHELSGPEARAAQSILSAQDTPTAAAAIVNEFLRPAEEHRERRANAYMAGSGSMPNAQPVQVAQAGGSPSIAELLSLSGDPNFGYASPAQQQIIQSLIGQNLQEQAQARDPLRQLQLEQLRREVEAEPFVPAPMTPEQMALWGIPEGSGSWTLGADGMPQQIFAPSSDTGFTLSPGQTRFGGGGEAIASVPAGPESLSENERQINALVDRGFSQAEAEDLAYGFVQTVVDPVLESPMIVNRTTGEGRYITPEEAAIIEETFPAATGGMGQPSPVPATADPVAGAFGALDEATDIPLQQQMDAERPTLWDISGGATGIVPSLQEGWTNIAGQFGASGFEGVVENRQMFDIEKNNLIRALSINPRFPVGEMERLEREINITPSAFNSANAMRARMIAINSALSTRLENELRSAADPNMPASARRNAIQAANDISNFLTTLGVPEGANAATGRGANDPAPENRPPLETFVRQ